MDADVAPDVPDAVLLPSASSQLGFEQRDVPIATVAPPPAPVDGQADVLLQVAEPAIAVGGEELGGGGGAGEGEGEGEEAMGCEAVANASSGAAPAAAAAPLPIQPPSNIGNGTPAPTFGPISFGDLFWRSAPPGIRCRIPGVKLPPPALGGVGLAFPPITINPPAASQTARVPPQQLEAMATAATATLPSAHDKTRFDAMMALRYPPKAKPSAPAPTISGGVASVGLGGAGEALGGGGDEMGRGERQGGGAEREGEGMGMGVGGEDPHAARESMAVASPPSGQRHGPQKGSDLTEGASQSES
ncbi:unnamed protein product [Vitrella brassicaformis CCMP3155]|uniref:Uncharacterized protein n=1 Tax=Vitrella brassicaformis (strain CCMP3155) TaxID=1169540 RepID=A0A0G4E8F4_VITBC|nr:unnamed protein product [Vitrella brassicaformis CCMP3155]|eukprot:CEL92018.1 unnamed protein product [Vitrella brassicaformis CCMP3155]